MQILSYPVGLLIGLLPIAVDLGETRAPAHLLLDSRPVCEVTVRSPGCTVDLGPDPRVHLLELVRTDAVGHVTERVHRWINRPGIEPEVLAAGGCDEKRHDCEFDVTWAHPRKLDPKRIALQLDGATVWQGPGHHARVPRGTAPLPQVVAVEAEFPDGTRAIYTRALYSSYPEEAQASLLAVPILPEGNAMPNEALTAGLKAAGIPVRAVEETEPEVTFVMARKAFDAIPGVLPRAMAEQVHMPVLSAAEGSTAFDTIRVLFPDESLQSLEIPLGRLGTVRTLTGSQFSRYADAVAAAGYSLGGTPRRRAVVLVLSGFDRPNVSSFAPVQAQAYLAEVMVPLIVWRVGNVQASEWPEGPRLETMANVQAALRAVRSEIDRQRIVWLEGFRDTRYTGRWLAPGVTLAGRGSLSGTLPPPAEAPALTSLRSGRSIGPDGGPVHALAAANDGSTVYAGTHAGVFRSRDGGLKWELASAGLPSAPVRCLAADRDHPTVVYAGTDAGLFRSANAGEKWSPVGGERLSQRVVSVALDPSNAKVVYAGAEGHGVLRSGDAGLTFLASSMTSGDARALAIDPRGRSVFAATEAGVLRSDDHGVTWTHTAKLPARALALALDGTGDARRLLAGTAGEGIFVSADSGATWSKTNLAGAFITDIRVDSTLGGRILAGSPARGSSRRRMVESRGSSRASSQWNPLHLSGSGSAGGRRPRHSAARGSRAAAWRESDDGLRRADRSTAWLAPRQAHGRAVRRNVDGPSCARRTTRTQWTCCRRSSGWCSRLTHVGLSRRSDARRFSVGTSRETSDEVPITASSSIMVSIRPARRSASSIDPSASRAVALAATRDGVLKSRRRRSRRWSPSTVRPREDFRPAARRERAGSLGRLRGDRRRWRLSEAPMARESWKETGGSSRA